MRDVWDQAAGLVFTGVLCAIALAGCTVAPPSPQELILQGVGPWNAWREANPAIVPDLTGIVLEGADLSAANLNATCLKGAVLRNARLSGATLLEADLSGADLGNAALEGAVLRGANLTAANLAGANFNRGDLAGANLVQANLEKTILTAADLSNANIDAIHNWRDIPDMQGANIYRVVRAPGGFKDFALERGANKDG